MVAVATSRITDKGLYSRQNIDSGMIEPTVKCILKFSKNSLREPSLRDKKANKERKEEEQYSSFFIFPLSFPAKSLRAGCSKENVMIS